MEGHRIWAASYDSGPNPLLALETRLLLSRLRPIVISRFLDVACGTGRWMQLARKFLMQQRGPQVFGVDFCPEMLLEAARKPGLAGLLSLADAGRIPLADGAVDLVLCSFALGYFPSAAQAIAEMARVALKGGRVVVTDLHPCALAAGWTRSFRSNGQVYAIDHHHHAIAEWRAAADSAGLTVDWVLEASFGEPERQIFRGAGKDWSFPEVSRIPALLGMAWVKS
jgi:malonyl-CoA O-methyltransferase